VAQPRHPTNNVSVKEFVSERRAADLLAQIRWRDGVYDAPNNPLSMREEIFCSITDN
jgi:hypothetical protein